MQASCSAISHSDIVDIPSIEPGALLIPLFDDLVDLLSMEAWETLWGYFESRGPRFTKVSLSARLAVLMIQDMPSSRGKALPLLKFLNSFYRYLPRADSYLSFRARVHEWAITAFEISDKSSVNFRGDFPLMARLAWEDEDILDEDVEMLDGEETAATDVADEAVGPDIEITVRPSHDNQDESKSKPNEAVSNAKIESEVPKAVDADVSKGRPSEA